MNQMEIKFRAWDGFNEEMLYPNKHGMFVKSGVYNYAMVLNYSQGLIPMQWTGIKDCKRTIEYPEGQDVYVGDKTVDGCIEFNVQTCCYIIRRSNGTFIRLDIKKDNIETIGNIYENPELVNEKQLVNQ